MVQTMGIWARWTDTGSLWETQNRNTATALGCKINAESIDDEDAFENYDGSYDVKDGGAAMKAYQDMLYTKDANRKSQIKK